MSTLRRDEKLCGGLGINFRLMSWLTGLLICVLPLHLGSESLTLSTYYPAPLGVYTELTTTGMTIMARDSDRMGIGTSNPFPTSKLHVSGGPIYVSDPGRNAGVFIEGSRILDKRDGIMRIRSSGNVIAFDDADNVGIGTAKPATAADLHVYDSSSNAFIYLESKGANHAALYFNTDGTRRGVIGYDETNDMFKINAGAGGLTGPAQHLSITSNGNIGIGTTSPQAQAKLHIGGKKGKDGIMFPDGSLQTTAKIFGVRRSRRKNTSYRAATDGFVTAWASDEFGGHVTQVAGFTDRSSNPAAMVIIDEADRDHNIDFAGISFPVKKGDYWKVTVEKGPELRYGIYWVPFGN